VANRNLEWYDAGLECRRLHKDAHLLVIKTAEEQKAVATMLASINRQCNVMFYFNIVSLLITMTMTIFFIMIKTYRSTLQTITRQPVTEDSNDRSKAYTVSQDSNNNQV